MVVFGFELKMALPWSLDYPVVAPPLFSREYSFRGLAWVVTATLCPVPRAQWLVQIIHWDLTVGGAPPCPVPS
jgi:hypothetical protein